MTLLEFILKNNCTDFYITNDIDSKVIRYHISIHKPTGNYTVSLVLSYADLEYLKVNEIAVDTVLISYFNSKFEKL